MNLQFLMMYLNLKYKILIQTEGNKEFYLCIGISKQRNSSPRLIPACLLLIAGRKSLREPEAEHINQRFFNISQ